MSVQFKFHDRVDQRRRRMIIKTLGDAGYAAESLFPGEKRQTLAAIFTVVEADAKSVRAALDDFGDEIEYVEASPKRDLKA
ncbi:hypothetical protein UB31_31035 [Bradyrhizobium sp. LTSP849]|uniref:hypothetical protein n=1 Tax=Bradyrhizobium sp. LTSP849 TaxID=1615890 RepID=UPI0005D2AA83|nr:hypothetical protein [Bradyrhizobium sp. LTSP849]KJC38181.1 hypothetical protein UB31_31035 [Bradyrhizobium sp. LTSP849]